ncbi:hypothetical protein BD408DRAFT_354459 [Parasitella parasitica]|nr:hypothetical protein BD408DRAFT_354459 [Parasitella parasitica]
MYQQPPPPPSIDSSTFYSNTDQDVHTHPDPSTAVRSSAKITQPSHIVEDQQKVYSFVPLDVISQQKRHRKKFNEVERLYSCTYLNCTKAYGTLNHLNAHVTMQGHGPKRMPIEFKELRRQLKKNRKMMQPPKSRKSSSSAPQKQQKQQQQQQQHIEKDVITNEQDDLLQQHPPSNFYVGEDYGNSSLMMNHPQPHQQQGFSLHGPLSKRPSSISPSFTPLQQQSFEAAASSAAMVSSSLYSTRYSHYTMMQQQQQQQFH